MGEPLAASAAIGGEWNRVFGATFAPSLQVLTTLRCLRRANYDDDAHIRVRRHAMLTADKGTGKSTFIRKYIGQCAGAQPYGSGHSTRAPTYIETTGDVTRERLRGGGADSGDLVKPLLPIVDYLLIPEFTSFIYPGPNFVKSVAQMCGDMEEGRAAVMLVKMKNASAKQRERFMEEIEGLPIEFDDVDGIIKFQVYSSYVAASHPMSDRDGVVTMREKGLLSRFDHSVSEPSEAQLRAATRHKFGEVTVGLVDKLREYNLRCFNTPVEHLARPPLSMKEEVIGFLCDHYDRICEDAGKSYRDIDNERDDVDVTQLLTFSAVQRAYLHAIDTDAKQIQELEYREEDVEWVKKYREPYLAELHRRLTSVAKEPRGVGGDMLDAVCGILEGRGVMGGINVRGRELADAISTRFGISRSTAYRKVSELEQARVIEGISFGEYRVISWEVLESLGMQHLLIEADG